MTDTADNDAFWNLVDHFIEQANSACDEADPSMVSAALLHATARFNAFVVAASSLDRKEYTEEIESARNYLTDRYRQQLSQELEDYRENYKVYVRADDPEAD